MRCQRYACCGPQVEGQQIPAEFTYSVTWRETTVPFEKRMDKYRRYQFLPQHLEVPRSQELCCSWLLLGFFSLPSLATCALYPPLII